MKPRFLLRCMVVMTLGLLTALPARGEPLPDDLHRLTLDAGRFLLEESVRPSPSGRHHLLLRALRHLRDPALAPFFARLADRPEADLRIHGLLGLAELDPARRLDLERVARIDDPRLQAELVSAALDGKLLPLDQARQMYGWKGTDDAVKVLLAGPLVQAGQLDDPGPLRRALDHPSLARRSIAALLLLQLDESAALPVLQALPAGDDPARAEVLDALLITARRYQLDRCGPWALSLAADPAVPPAVARRALEVALRFAGAPAAALWRQRFDDSAQSPAERMRLALLALEVAPWVDADIYQPLILSPEPLLQAIGRAGAAVAGGQPAAEPLAALLNQKAGAHLVLPWALNYAREHARPEEAAAMVTAILDRPDPEQDLHLIAQAVQLLVERHPAQATAVLRPRLQSPAADPLVVRAMLLGMVQAEEGQPHGIVEGLAPASDYAAASLLCLLQARRPGPLSQAQLEELALLARGGTISEPALRIQAAWLYLRATGETGRVLPGP